MKRYGMCLHWISAKTIFLVLICAAFFAVFIPGAMAEGVLYLPANLEVVEAEAFVDNPAHEVIFPEGILRIEQQAFAGCDIQTLNFPASLTYIAENAFPDCDPVVTVVPGSYGEAWAELHGWLCNYDGETLVDHGFAYETFTNSSHGLNGFRITAAPMDSVNLFLPDMIDGVTVYSIGNNLQLNNTSLRYVHLPRYTFVLGAYAFSGCTSLGSIAFPETLWAISGYAFYGCTSLYELTLPNSVQYILASAFEGCTGLNGQLILPQNDELMVMNRAFANCGFTGTVRIPYNIYNWGSEVFKGCSGITRVEYNGYGMMPGMFSDCTSLESVSLYSTNIEIIPSNAFSGCSSLSSINIPSSVKYIETRAFYNCVSLSGYLFLPATQSVVGEEAFSGCINITEIYCDATWIYRNAFSGCLNLRRINLGSNVQEIKANAFSACYSLTETITIPSTVSIVDSTAFDYCPCTVIWKGSVIHNSGTSTAEAVIAIAKGEVGYLEKASNSQLDDFYANAGSGDYTKYAAYFDNLRSQGVYYFNGNKNGYNWCAIFVNWCFAQAFGCEKAHALLCQPASNTTAASCTYSRNFFANAGRFGSTPQVGAQIFFYDSAEPSSLKYYHTGIVYAVDDDYVYTIEGNISNKVAYKKYSRSTVMLDATHSIGGYGYPLYGM